MNSLTSGSDDIDIGVRIAQFLRRQGIEAVVGGGAIRDTVAERPLKDVDVFVDVRGSTAYAVKMLLGMEYGEIKWTPGIQYWRTAREVKGLGALPEGTGTVPITVILLEQDVVESMKDNDFGICQAWVNADRTFSFTPAFMRDISHKTFTLLSCEDEKDHARSMRRWDRLQQKYSDHTLVDKTPYADPFTLEFTK